MDYSITKQLNSMMFTTGFQGFQLGFQHGLHPGKPA